MLIGEAPGATEDRVGRPFIGRAGQVLSKIIRAAGHDRSEIYITNIVKCHPMDRWGKNRPPTSEEIATCSTYLLAEIERINPVVISPLGNSATRFFIPNSSISHVHGKPYDWKGKLIIPQYHPAVAMYDKSMFDTLVDDMKIVGSYIEYEMDKGRQHQKPYI